MSGRTSSISGTVRARLPFVPLSMSPPGLGVVCRRTVQVQASRSMSAQRTPDTSPIRGRGARGEDDDIGPAVEMIGRTGDERRSQVAERRPIRQRQGARVVEFVLGALIVALPADDAGG